MSSSRRRILEFAIVPVAVAAALILRWFMDPMVGDRIAFPTVLAAVAVAVGFGGLYPALLATVLGYFGGAWLFLESRGRIQFANPSDWITLAGYLLACFTVILFGLLMRRAQRRHQAAAARLVELNRRKDDLLATIAHEMRNPLQPIRTAAMVLRMEDGASARVEQSARLIEHQVDQLARLIDDLVAMDRIARHGLELRRARLSFVALVERVVEARRSLLNPRHTLVLDLTDRPLFVEADSQRLEQVIVNLLTNAVKFSPEGGRIAIIVQSEDARVKLCIRDLGVGIPPEAMPRIFEMFFRAEPSLPGLGIGLTLVRQLVEMHGGTVTAASKGAGLGSEFIVVLPLATNQEEEEEEGELATAGAEAVGTAAGGSVLATP